LGRNVRRLHELRLQDPNFPKPVRQGSRHMYLEHEFLDWYRTIISNR
jgi:predicted DNA-binding transcriptional regulator AlpA